jgi:hypothetical protein
MESDPVPKQRYVSESQKAVVQPSSSNSGNITAKDILIAFFVFLALVGYATFVILLIYYFKRV